jgi:hypothetical protein
MEKTTRAQLAQRITNLQKLQNILKLNTDVSILMRCNLVEPDKSRTILYELKQNDTPFDIAEEIRDFLQDSINLTLEQLNQIPVI